MAAPDRLARTDELRRRARADRRLVPRERGLVAGASPSRRARLLVLGAGAAQPGLLEAARGAGAARDRRRPRSAGSRVRARRRAGRDLVGGRAGDRAARAGARGRRPRSRRAPTGRSGSRRGSPSGCGLPHPIDGATAALATTKTRQRERLAAAGVPQPRIFSAGDPAIPVPVRRQGARPAGPARPHARPERARARAGARGGSGGVARRRRYSSRSSSTGPEVTVNAVSIEGRFVPLTVTDRITAEPPAFGVALAHAWPSAHPTERGRRGRAAGREALGIATARRYTQIRLGPDGPRGDRGGRPARRRPRRRALQGGDRRRPRRPRRLVRARQSARDGLSQGRRAPAVRASSSSSPRRESCARSTASTRRRRVDGIEWVRSYRRAGWRFGAFRRGADRAGAILAVGDSRDDALARARRAAEAVRFQVDADPS